MEESTTLATTSCSSMNNKFVMPAEWTTHSACLLLYPHNAATFRLTLAQHEFINVAKAIVSEGKENVIFFCLNEIIVKELREQLKEFNQQQQQLQSQSTSPTQIHVMVCPSDDTWVRDTGPTFVISKNSSDNKKELIGLDWDFNAYGGPTEGCYWPCENDQKIAQTICQALSSSSSNIILEQQNTFIKSCKIPLILEGGSIHTDGEGTILVTKECLCHTNRNPNKNQNEIESIILKALGGTKMIWLPYGLDGDNDTNGHIDNVCLS